MDAQIKSTPRRSIPKNQPTKEYIMTMNMKSINKACMSAVAAAFAFVAVTAIAQPSPAVKEDQAQMKSDNATLQR
jgi:hypothetical protein